MNNEYKEWMEKAEEDLDTANYNLQGNKLGAAAFFMQQSAEKALKALHIKKFGKFPKTHDLVSLSRELKVPENILSCAKLLSPAYQYTRYPDIMEPHELEAEINELNSSCKEIIKW